MKIPATRAAARTACLLSLALAPQVLAQSAPDAPIVKADKVVVAVSPVGDQSEPEVFETGGSPSEQTWDRVVAEVSNLQVEAAGTNSFGAVYTLRGLANTPYFSDPAVALYFDDIPLGGSFSYPSDLFGFGSAAVYKGPQPTGFGRAGDGGVIVLAPPNPSGPAANELTAEIGDYDMRTVALNWAGSEGRSADADVAVASSQRDGYVYNTQLGQSVDSERALSAFVRERFRPTASSELTLEAIGDRHRDGAAPLVPLDGPLYTVERSQEGETDSSMVGAALKGVWETPVGQLSADTSFTNWRLDPYEDWLVLPPPLASHLTQSQTAWNEELRFSSRRSSRFSWDGGAWVSDAVTDGGVQRNIKGFIPLDASTFITNAHDYALFGQAVFTPVPDWKLSVGARAERTEKNYHQAEQVPTPGLNFHYITSYDVLLPKAILTHEIGEGASAYASVSCGARPGGFSPYTDNPAYIPFKAEHLVAYEAGIDHPFADRTVSIGARAFAYAIENYQIERSFSAADYFVATAPRARSQGAELDASWRPSNAWSFGIVAGLTDVALTEFRDPITGQSLNGDRAPYAPAFTSGGNAAYRSRAGIFATAQIEATGKTFYVESEDPRYAQAAYAVIDARIGYEATRWKISLYIRNAADKGYYALIVPGVSSASPGVPRTLGGDFTVKF